jgi:hypothetical protein
VRFLDLFRTRRKARVDTTQAVIDEAEQRKLELRRAVAQLAEYVKDLRALTREVQQERRDPRWNS